MPPYKEKIIYIDWNARPISGPLSVRYSPCNPKKIIWCKSRQVYFHIGFQFQLTQPSNTIYWWRPDKDQKGSSQDRFCRIKWSFISEIELSYAFYFWLLYIFYTIWSDTVQWPRIITRKRYKHPDRFERQMVSANQQKVKIFSHLQGVTADLQILAQ